MNTPKKLQCGKKPSYLNIDTVSKNIEIIITEYYQIQITKNFPCIYKSLNSVDGIVEFVLLRKKVEVCENPHNIGN